MRQREKTYKQAKKQTKKSKTKNPTTKKQEEK